MSIEFSSTYAIDRVNREYEKQGKYGQGSGGRWVANNANSWGDQIALRSGQDSIVPNSARFVADDGTIVNLADMKPQTDDSHCSRQPVRFVLEMNQGWFAKRNIQAGYRLGGAPFSH